MLIYTFFHIREVSLPKDWNNNLVSYLTEQLSRFSPLRTTGGSINFSIDLEPTKLILKINNLCTTDSSTREALKIIILNYFIRTNMLSFFTPPTFSEIRNQDAIVISNILRLENLNGQAIPLEDIPTIETLPTSRFEEEIIRYQFPQDKIPKNFICPLSMEIMTDPYCMDSTLGKGIDLLSLHVHLWIKGGNPLTNEPYYPEFKIYGMRGRLYLIQTFLNKVKYCHENQLDYLTHLDAILAKESYQRFLSRFDQQTEAPILTIDEIATKGINLILNEPYDFLLGIEYLVPILDQLPENSSVLKLCHFALFRAYNAIEEYDQSQTYLPLLLSQFNSEEPLASYHQQIKRLLLELTAANRPNIALVVARSYKDLLESSNNKDHSINLSETIQFNSKLQYLKAVTNFRTKKYNKHPDKAITTYYRILDIAPNFQEVIHAKNALLNTPGITLQPLKYLSFQRIQQILNDAHSVELELMIKTLIAHPELLNCIDPQHDVPTLILFTELEVGLELLRTRPELRTLITEFSLNYVSSKENIKGHSPLLRLSWKPKGRELLANDSDLINKINAEGLCARSTSNTSALFFLLSNQLGIELFINYPKLRKMISEEAFNLMVTSDQFKGHTPLMGLVRFDKGFEILASDADLRSLISAESLEQISMCPTLANINPLILMCAKDIGIKLLADDEQLRAKITTNALNWIIPEGENQGISALYMLTIKSSGFSLLLADKNLRDMIQSESLAHICQAKNYIKVSPLFLMTYDEIGLQVLKVDSDLTNKITSEALNHVYEEDQVKGASALLNICVSKYTDLLENYLLSLKVEAYALEAVSRCKDTGGLSPTFVLTGTQRGRKVLVKNSHLLEKFTPEGLNYVVTERKDNNGTSPLFFLCQPDGLEVLDKASEEVYDLIKSTTLLIPSESINAGTRPLLSLLNTQRGFEILSKSSTLRAKITNILNYVIPDGKFKDYSVLSILCSQSDGLRLLSMNPEWREKIRPETLNTSFPQSNPNEAISPLLMITQSQYCNTMLTTDNILISKISAEGLNYSPKSGPYQGISPLTNIILDDISILEKEPTLRNMITSDGLESVSAEGVALLSILTGKENGRSLLAADPILRGKISSKALNHVIPAGTYEGTSPLLFLMLNDDGLNLLFRDPNLLAKIDQKSLSSISKNICKGTAPIFILFKEPLGRRLLKISAQLRSKISFDLLTMQIQEDPDKFFSPIIFLLKDTAGSDLLKLLIRGKPELFYLIVHFTQKYLPNCIESFLIGVITDPDYSPEILHDAKVIFNRSVNPASEVNLNEVDSVMALMSFNPSLS